MKRCHIALSITSEPQYLKLTSSVETPGQSRGPMWYGGISVLNTLQVRTCLHVDTSMSGAAGPVGAATGPVVGCPKEDAGCFLCRVLHRLLRPAVCLQVVGASV